MSHSGPTPQQRERKEVNSMLKSALKNRWDFHSLFSFLLHTQEPSMGDGRSCVAEDHVWVPRTGARDLALAMALL